MGDTEIELSFLCGFDFQTRAAAGGGRASRKASTARRSGGRTTCGKAWAPSRSEAWNGTSIIAQLAAGGFSMRLGLIIDGTGMKPRQIKRPRQRHE